MTEPIMNVFEVLDKLDFFNQRAGRELWSENPIDVQNKDIENFSNDVAFLKEYITSQNAELLQYAKDQHDLMIEKDELFDIAEKQKAEIEFLIRMKASDFETSYTAVKARLADEMNRAEMDRRKDTEIRRLRVKLDDCERDIIPKLKYSLERANKYGVETDAENIRLLKENENLTSANENLTSDLTSAKAKIERLEGCVKSEEEVRGIMKSQMTPTIQELIKEQIDRATKIGELKGILDFTERLCEGRVSNDPVVIAVKFELKEMIGERK